MVKVVELDEKRVSYILLEDGTLLKGQSIGASKETEGEIVFSTGMTGYVESLTDPSYKNQILVLTYPLIGNYGVPKLTKDELGLPKYFESEKIHAAGLVVGDYCDNYSHWNADKSLSQWLVESDVPGITGIDTRRLTKILREKGSMLAKLFINVIEPPIYNQEKFINPNNINLVDLVSTKKAKIFNKGGNFKIAALDFGIKYNQIRILSQLGACVHVLPWNDETLSLNDFDGLFLSNGPGDPTQCQATIRIIKKWLNNQSNIIKPIFGICLGHQLLSLAAGFTTAKMKYGNRGHNQPCTLYGTKRCYITCQNHGYAADINSNSEASVNWDTLFYNENDKSNEGIVHKTLPYFSVQFHPEHMAGPKDTEFLFDLFINAVDAYKNKKEYHLKEEIYNKANAGLSTTAQLSVCFRPKKVLLLGSGGLSIGQAGEFDYSGSQAIKAYKEENVYIVLINPNIATIQTSKGLADKVYFLPITPDYVTEIIKCERPDAISLSFGGQTALNCGIELYKNKVFEEFNVKVLGTPIESIIMSEDRQEFAQQMASIDEKVAPCEAATTLEQAIEAGDRLGFPLLIRAAFALGGLGSGFAYNKEDLIQLATSAFAMTNQILIDKSLKGWKEIEYEVVRDSYDNCITVCNMENIDPLGIHTGESIVVAPSQTLTNEEYNVLRNTALKVIRSLGVVGECNIQYALNPMTLEYYIIEVNARLSRSSALASKATGYPLAYIAAKLSLGYSLVELRNSVTQSTTACFEPSLDYCVVKVPRWDLDKFVGRVSNKIGSSMKSVGEVMAIGRGFEEAFQKALRMIDDRVTGFDPYCELSSSQNYEQELRNPTDRRIFVLAAAMKTKKFTIDELYDMTRIDKWFLYKFNNIIEHCDILETKYRLLKPSTSSTSSLALIESNENNEIRQRINLDKTILMKCKKLGFSDKQIALHVNSTELEIRMIRKNFKILPFIKRIDTVAGEYPAKTNYLYLTYNGSEHDINNFEDNAVCVLGSGVYRIGSSVEFDWCAVSCLKELKTLGYKTIMINYNPETVSTDYDMSDKLYFEELSFETVMTIYEFERPRGIILSMGGQIPNNLAIDLHRQKVKVLGTCPESIDNAENRFKFSRMLDNIGILQPKWKELQNLKSAFEFCEQVGYPCLVRPSYVLSGAAMKVAYNQHELEQYLKVASSVSKEHPVVISKFILDAKEIDIDAVAKDGEILCMAISSHVENAGVHSGDATLITPPAINNETMSKIKVITSQIACALHVNGPFNLQLIAKDNELKVIECNLRVSRSFPFVSKTLDHDFIAVATQVAMGLSPPAVDCIMGVGRIGVKVPQFSFSRLTGADVLLGVEMVSTGEVACFGENTYEAYLKALLSTGFRLPKKNILLSVGSYKDKVMLMDSVKTLEDLGFNLYASRGTADFYSEHNIKVETVDWCYEDGNARHANTGAAETDFLSNPSNNQRTVADYLTSKHFDLVINIPMKNSTLRASSFITQGYQTRRIAIDYSVPLMTNVKNVKLLVQSLKACNCIKPPIKTIVDCVTKTRLVKLPGLIDVHVHLREPGGNHKEDITSGTSAALAGGYTMVCAMPNTNPAVVNEESLKLVENLYEKKALCDYGIYLGAAADNSTIIPELANRSCGLKMYLNETFNALKMDKMEQWIKHFQNWPKSHIICFHSEEHTLAAVLFLAELYDRKVHICHVSTKEDILLIKAAKEKGIKVTCEVAPHHLFFSQADLNQFNAQMKEVRPKLKTEEDRKALWDLLDWIDVIASDHAPHTIEEKQKNSMPGFPGLETSLPLLITAYKQGKISMEAIIQKCYTNPKRIFDLPEQTNTYIEVDLDTEWTIPNEMPFSKCKWTPFAGLKVFGLVRRVILRGEVVYVDGQILVKPGYGKNIASVSRKEVKLSGPKVELKNEIIPPKLVISSEQDVDLLNDKNVTQPTNSPSFLSELISKKKFYEPESPLKNSNLQLSPKMTSQFINSVLNENSINGISNVRRKKLTSISNEMNDFNENYFKQQQQSIQIQQKLQSGTANANQLSIQSQYFKSPIEVDITEQPEKQLQLASPNTGILLNTLYKSNLVTVDCLSKDMMHKLFNLAHDLRLLTLSEKDLTYMLRGKIIAQMFFEPSTRTQCSFAAATQRLGGTIVYMDQQHSSVKKGETLEDSVRMMSAYSDLIVIRHPEPGAAEQATFVSDKPLVNAGDGTGEHPTQALLDIFTIREEIGTVNGITITMVGDLKHGRTVHSLAKLLKLYRVTIRYVSPSFLKMPANIVQALKESGINQEEFDSLEEALPETDVLYMTRIQKERFSSLEEYQKAAGMYIVTPQLMRKAKKKMIVMHPLPRVDEISTAFDSDPRAAYFRQAEYGMYVRMALLLKMLKKDLNQ